VNLLAGRIEPKLLLPAPQHRKKCGRCGSMHYLTKSHVPQRWLYNLLRSQTPRKQRQNFPLLAIRILCRRCHDTYTRGEIKIVRSFLNAAADSLITYHAEFERDHSKFRV
jgi:hypothetical protein